MKKILGWWFTFSPLLIGAIWLLTSLVFRSIGLVGELSALSLTIKSFVNRGLGMLAFVSLPLMVVGIVFLSTAKSKNASLFTIKEIVQYSRKTSKKHMSKFLLGFGVYLVIQSISSAFGYSEETGHTQLRNIGVTFIVMLATVWIGLGYKNIALKIVHDVKAKSVDVFVGIKKYITYLAAYALTYGIVFIGLVLFIVPGILFGIKLSMVPYLILDKHMGSIQALKTSWKITTGFVGDILLLNLLCGLINVLGMLALFVGLLWTLPLLIIANTYLYKKIVASIK